MKLISIIIAGFFLISGPAELESEIPWDNRELRWSDFKQRVGAQYTYKAETHSGIRYEISTNNGGVVIDIETYFLTEDSWVVKGSESDYLLNHEQKHFDITEIFSRKLRKEFDQYQGMSSRAFMNMRGSDKVDRVYHTVYDEMETMQRKYDRETNHSISRTNQSEWNEIVSSQLRSLSKWSKVQ